MKKSNLPVPGFYPFWFWNGDQEKSELVRQVKLFADSGCRGAVLHCRTGNLVPYLSEEWLGKIRFTCEQCAKSGLKAWLYDEDGFPSGNAGMQIQKLWPHLCQQFLTCSYGKTSRKNPGFAAYDPETFALLEETSVPDGTDALLFKKRILSRHVDTLNPETCGHFIELTHEKYKAAVGDLFGSVIEAVYTDDESFISCCVAGGIVYSESLEQEYEKRYGASFRSILPLLAEELPGSGEVRIRFYELAQELFLKNFIEPQKRWCEENGLVYLGHLCGDEGPIWKSIQRYGSPAPYFHLEDVPSVDDFLTVLPDCGYLRTLYASGGSPGISMKTELRSPIQLYKQASSVANQFKNDLVSAENWTYLSWNTSPDFLETQTFFEIGMGVNLLTPHAFYYTLGHGTKDDCPPSYFFQQPYFPLLGTRIRQWTGLMELLKEGESAAELLVLFPRSFFAFENGHCSDLQFNLKTQDDERLLDADVKYNSILMALSRKHVSFDLGDEQLLLRSASVRDGRLVMGKHSYGTVLLPPFLPPDPKTAELLAAFSKEGGKIIFTSADAVPDLQLGGEADQVLVCSRKFPDGGFLRWLVNLAGRDVKLSLTESFDLRICDPVHGVSAQCGNSLPAGFVLRKGTACLLLPVQKTFGRDIPFDSMVYSAVSGWKSLEPLSIELLRENTLVLKHPSDVEIECSGSTKVSAVYAERTDSIGLTVNGVAVSGDAAVHPCDPCYIGIRSGNSFLNPGKNRLRCSNPPGLLYLEGRFGVKNGKMVPEETCVMGDLSGQGYPYYFGSVLYRFAFDGKPEFLHVKQFDGMARIRVNGKECAVELLSDSVVPLEHFCTGERNTLEIEVFNTVCNFVTGEKTQKFGLDTVEISG